MTARLFVYDSLFRFRQVMKDHRLYSVTFFFAFYNNVQELSSIDADEFENSIIDLSVIARENISSLFAEQYIYKLYESIESIHFCINASSLAALLERFPLLFDEEQIDMSYNIQAGLEKEVSNAKNIAQFIPVSLYAYDDFDTLRKNVDSSQFISLANLLEESQGALFSYHIPSIDGYLASIDSSAKYIDISSIVRAAKLRNDYIYQIEVLMYHVVIQFGVKLCIENSLAQDALKYFPFVFSKVEFLDETLTKEMVSADVINAPQVATLQASADRICASLKGHEVFKKDFKRNLLKFSFLNQIQERKLLSIILCGVSGIGKTQFAKIASEVLYPNEQLIKINFGNYSTEGVLNSLIGSPLGYVGSEEGGELINKIALSKSKVILIDEFERATPSVYNFFYELLEDGIFTDRHGVQHDLNGYIIIFTSNMSQEQYKKHIPDSLKSRFDMIYYFEDLPDQDKRIYIYETAEKLCKRLTQQFGVTIDAEKMKDVLDDLIAHSNLRYIKRRIEDIVFNEFFNIYSAQEGTNQQACPKTS